ncbi:MAG: hypothetical protein M1837_003285 [Sclerophora amabilis]|nr:MAG: hypothetical protein M1837_003285 [Sclerophora amabilis]
MSTAGPELPPHLLAKRKREAEEGERSVSDSKCPTSRSPTPDSVTKRRRVVGPSLPPAPLDGRPIVDSDADDTSSSDDELGPALPPAPGQNADIEAASQRKLAQLESDLLAKERERKPQREEWMLVPPKQDDWSSKVDPTKLRNRKFNTGKGAKAPAQKTAGESTIWTETLEQKRQRLEDEVMGVVQPAAQSTANSQTERRPREGDNTAKRIQEYNDKHRNKSLYVEHKNAGPREKEDDPSKRAFDREKDIAGGRKIGHAQRKELLNRAADFGSKFSGGNFL